MKKVLFVTWDGPDQTYLESLFLPIFSRLLSKGFAFSVLQFRWGPAELTERARLAAHAAGIGYRAVQIARRPKAIGALTTAAWGARVLQRELSRDVDVVMPRSILPALMVNLIKPRQPILFDADGLPADERVEFGGWNSSGVWYRAWREIEAEAVRRASAVLTRTVASRDVLLSRAGPSSRSPSIVVAPNGKDEGLFCPADEASRDAFRRSLGIPVDAPWLLFVGTVGPQYCLPEALAFYEQVRARLPSARLTMLTGQEEEARALLARHPAIASSVDVRRVRADEVPRYLTAADLGLALRQPSFSQRAVSPIKVGEYLLCGLPVLATTGVGDLEQQLSEGEGRLLGSMAPPALAAAADWFAQEVLPRRERFRVACRSAGLAHFSLTTCVERYAQALRSCQSSSELISARDTAMS